MALFDRSLKSKKRKKVAGTVGVTNKGSGSRGKSKKISLSRRTIPDVPASVKYAEWLRRADKKIPPVPASVKRADAKSKVATAAPAKSKPKKKKSLSSIIEGRRRKRRGR